MALERSTAVVVRYVDFKTAVPRAVQAQTSGRKQVSGINREIDW